MRLVLNFLVTIILVSGLLAGDLFIDVEDTIATGEPGNSFIFEGYLHNLGANMMLVQLTRTVNDIPETWTTTLCYGANCYPPHISAPDPVAVNAGDSVFFDIVFNTDDQPNSGQAVLRFEDLITGQKDSVRFSVKTEIPPAFSFTFDVDSVKIMPTESYTFETYIHNLTDSAMIMQVTRLENDLPDEWTTTMCLGNSCYPPGTSQVNSVIMPGDSLFFDLVFNTNEFPDTGRVLLEFLDLTSGQSKQQKLVVVSEKPEPVFTALFGDTALLGKPGDELISAGMLYNTSDSTQKVVIIRTLNQLPEGWTSSLCFESCYAPQIDTISTNINKGDSLEFSIHFFTDDQPGIGKVVIQIFAQGSLDTVEQTITAETQSTVLEGSQNLNPAKFTVLGNYPNPFNNTTTIQFYVPAQNAEVTLKIFSITGKLVMQKSFKNLSRGLHSYHFSAETLASGLYFYQFKAQELSGKIEWDGGKLLLLK